MTLSTLSKSKGDEKMKIVGITACSAGIAHTYIAKEKIEQAAKECGDTIHIETQGTIGTENELTPDEIKEADVVLLAVDVKISGRERFKGKKIVQISTDVAIQSPVKLIRKLHSTLNIS